MPGVASCATGRVMDRARHPGTSESESAAAADGDRLIGSAKRSRNPHVQLPDSRSVRSPATIVDSTDECRTTRDRRTTQIKRSNGRRVRRPPPAAMGRGLTADSPRSASGACHTDDRRKNDHGLRLLRNRIDSQASSFLCRTRKT
jgi:hypothetical protein